MVVHCWRLIRRRKVESATSRHRDTNQPDRWSLSHRQLSGEGVSYNSVGIRRNLFTQHPFEVASILLSDIPEKMTFMLSPRERHLVLLPVEPPRPVKCVSLWAAKSTASSPRPTCSLSAIIPRLRSEAGSGEPKAVLEPAGRQDESTEAENPDYRLQILTWRLTACRDQATSQYSPARQCDPTSSEM